MKKSLSELKGDFAACVQAIEVYTNELTAILEWDRNDWERLEVACIEVVKGIQSKTAYDHRHRLIRAVHLLAANHQSAQNDELLLFVYKDFPSYGAVPGDFYRAYNDLVTYPIKGREIGRTDKVVRALYVFNFKTTTGLTPLHLATRYFPIMGSNCENSMRILLDNTNAVVIAARDDEGNNLFHLIGKYWLQNKMDINETCKLIFQLVAIKDLINKQDANGNTLLHIICAEWPGSGVKLDEVLMIVDRLVKELGANTTIPNKLRNLPIHTVFLTWYKASVTVDQLSRVLDYFLPKPQGEDWPIDRVNLAGETLLHIVCSHWTQFQPMNRDIFKLITATLDLLFNRDATALVATKAGFTPLHYICQLSELNNQQAMVICRKLLKRSPSLINALTDDGLSALDYFCIYWRENEVKHPESSSYFLNDLDYFLSCGADMNSARVPAFHLLAHFWSKHEESCYEMNLALRRMKDKGAQLAGVDVQYGHGNLLNCFAENWVAVKGVRQDPYYAIDQLFELAPDLDVNAHVQGKNSPPINTICRTWLVKGVTYSTVMELIENLVTRGANLNLKDEKGETPTEIIAESWLWQEGMSEEQVWDALVFCLNNGAEFLMPVDQSFTVLRLAIKHTTPATMSIFTTLLSKFTGDVVIQFAAHPEIEKSLFGSLCLCKAGAVQAVLRVLITHLLTAKLPLETVWSNLDLYDQSSKGFKALDHFYDIIRKQGSVAQILALARYYRLPGKFKKLVRNSTAVATDCYQLALEKLIGQAPFDFTSDHIPMIDEIAEFTQRPDLPDTVDHRSHVGTALGLLVGDKAIPQEVSKDVVKGLLAISRLLLASPACRITLLNTLIMFVDDEDNDGYLLVELLQGINLERLFVKMTLQPKAEASSSWLSFFSTTFLSDADDPAYSTDAARVYVHIVNDQLYVELRRRFSPNSLSPVDERWRSAVNELLIVCNNRDLPFPREWLDRVFTNRIQELNALSDTLSQQASKSDVRYV